MMACTPGPGAGRPLTPRGSDARGLSAESQYLWVWSHSIGPPCLVNCILSTLNQSIFFFLFYIHLPNSPRQENKMNVDLTMNSSCVNPGKGDRATVLRGMNLWKRKNLEVGKLPIY